MFQRYLDQFEERGVAVWVTCAIEFEGVLEEQILRSAFDRLCDCYPLLCARVRRDHNGYLLYSTPGHRPEFVVLKDEFGVLQGEADRDLDIAHAVVRLTLIRGNGRGYVAFKVNHAVGDGRAWEAIFRSLWRIYDDLSNGFEDLTYGNASLPRSYYSLMAERWGEFRPRSLSDISQSGKPVVGHADTRREMRRIRLSEAETRKLVAAARRLDTSVHALTCGSTLVTLRQNDGEKGSMPMLCVSAIDLRKRVTPAVGMTETTNFISFHPAELTVSEVSDPIRIAQELKCQLDLALAMRNLPAPDSFWKNDEFANYENLWISASNLGVAPTIIEPVGLRITDLLWLQSSTVPTTPPMGGRLLQTIHTYKGRISMHNSYPADFCARKADLVLDTTVGWLRSIAACHGS